MHYGLTFAAELYDFEREERHDIVTRPGDYIRMMRWRDERQTKDADLNSLEINYAVVYFALKRLGRLEEFGLPDVLDDAAIEAMADRVSVYVDSVKEDTLPLRTARGR